MTEFEGGDVGSAYDLVVCVHVSSHAVGLGISYLGGGLVRVGVEMDGGMGGRVVLPLSEIAVAARRDELTSISKKFSGGPYISSKLCWRESGIACMIAVRRWIARDGLGSVV